MLTFLLFALLAFKALDCMPRLSSSAASLVEPFSARQPSVIPAARNRGCRLDRTQSIMLMFAMLYCMQRSKRTMVHETVTGTVAAPHVPETGPSGPRPDTHALQLRIGGTYR